MQQAFGECIFVRIVADCPQECCTLAKRAREFLEVVTAGLQRRE